MKNGTKITYYWPMRVVTETHQYRSETAPVSSSISVNLADLLIECQIYQQMKYDKDPVEVPPELGARYVKLFLSGS